MATSVEMQQDVITFHYRLNLFLGFLNQRLYAFLELFEGVVESKASLQTN